jgi:LmbE family N-acetylglucosaminyl deacetylase
MQPSLTAPGTTETVRASRALVVAPHYDDEVLGCGGLVARLTAAGAAVRALFLSDGRGGVDVEDRDAYGARRRAEAERAAAVLGLAGSEHLELPDGALEDHLEAIAEGVRAALTAHRPELLLVPSPLEASADHRAAFHAVHRVLAALRDEELAASLRVLAYEVNHPLYPDLLVDVGAELPRLAQAMGCYASQQERHDYLGARLGLLRFRALTLAPGVEAAEAYRRLAVADFATSGPARLIAELGGAAPLVEVREGPRISVIVRTRDRPELLAEALASLAAGTYRRAEVLVVNDGGAPPELPADFPLPLRRLDLAAHGGRAAAANAGIAAAGGDCVAFLDDDDLAEPEHLATLAGLASAAGVAVAYTDAAVGVYELGAGGWSCVERRLPYSRDFDADLLLFDNYIPFNTLVIERRLLAEVGELDVGLPFFEDWDLLIRLAARASFHHLARVTCEYRHFRGAAHHVLGDVPRRRADFLEMKARVLAKHAGRRTDAALARVVDLLRAETVAEREERDRLRRELGRAEERFHEANGRLGASEVHARTLEESRRRLAAELETQRREHREADRELDRLYAREQALEGEIRELSAQVERLHRRERELVAERDGAHGAHGDAVERLRLMTEQEARVAAELRATYAEIERLTALIREMESTRAWRAHQWWQQRKG